MKIEIGYFEMFDGKFPFGLRSIYPFLPTKFFTSKLGCIGVFFDQKTSIISKCLLKYSYITIFTLPSN